METRHVVGLFTIPPALSAATALGVQKVAEKYGHTFMSFGSMPQIAAVAAIHSLAALILSAVFVVGFDTKKNSSGIKTLGWVLLGHLLPGAILYGVAEKMKLTSSRISLLAVGILAATSLVANIMTLFFCTGKEEKKADQKKG